MPRTPDPRTIDFSNQILAFIVEYKTQHDGLSPTLRDISAKFFISVSHAKWYLDKLESAGKIALLGHNTRGIMVCGGKWEMGGLLE